MMVYHTQIQTNTRDQIESEISFVFFLACLPKADENEMTHITNIIIIIIRHQASGITRKTQMV